MYLPEMQQDGAMADDKKVTNSTPDEQQDADKKFNPVKVLPRPNHC